MAEKEKKPVDPFPNLPRRSFYTDARPSTGAAPAKTQAKKAGKMKRKTGAKRNGK